GLNYIQQIEEKLTAAGVGSIGSVIGRFYAMDRDLRWERVESAYQMLTKGANKKSDSAQQAIQDYYDNPTESNRRGDEFIEAVSISPGDQAAKTIQDGDAIIFLNYRGDRTREITKAFVCTDDQWNNIDGGGFDRGNKLNDLYYATMTGYESGLPVEVIFEKRERMTDILGEYISSLGLKQLRCAETEKYPHVTFFFNDYFDDPFQQESRSLVPSPRDVSTYDQKPEMSAIGIADAVVKELGEENYDLVIVNFANGDMVGHTGNLKAAVSAVETVDACVGRVVEKTLALGGSLIVTADHGNCEQMVDPESGGPHTAHTTYQVPLIVVDPEFKNGTLKTNGRLADIAPTALALLGIPQPPEMSGQGLIAD
ncbi:MAG: 2,3-bisphosphoglycerate-independent phosphoglycerate mutase, partial [Planctomycetota bacterium]|nr:2,3-bisphosphoglycerate-independent phosphoglycerate mutase [Planctomycetota bacterium]